MADSKTALPKVTLYWLNTSRSQRILWLLEECRGTDYDVKVYKRGQNHLAPEELKKIHPLGKSPIISIEAADLTAPLVIAESGPMMEYLCDHFATHLIPKRWQEGKEGQVGGETEEWLRYRYYMHYAEGSLMTLLLIALFMDQIRNAPVPFFIRPIVKAIPARIETMFLNKNFETHWSFLESQLKSSPNGGKYLCGSEITAADILMSFPLFVARGSKGPANMSNYPQLLEYTKLLEKNEMYQRSIKKIEEVSGEPFKAML